MENKKNVLKKIIGAKSDISRQGVKPVTVEKSTPGGTRGASTSTSTGGATATRNTGAATGGAVTVTISGSSSTGTSTDTSTETQTTGSGKSGGKGTTKGSPKGEEATKPFGKGPDTGDKRPHVYNITVNSTGESGQAVDGGARKGVDAKKKILKDSIKKNTQKN